MGFIGFHLCKSLLDDGIQVFGIDNLNDYYDPDLKQARLNQLLSYTDFTFSKSDIVDMDEMDNAFQSFKPQKVVNLAGKIIKHENLSFPNLLYEFDL